MLYYLNILQDSSGFSETSFIFTKLDEHETGTGILDLNNKKLTFMTGYFKEDLLFSDFLDCGDEFNLLFLGWKLRNKLHAELDHIDLGLLWLATFLDKYAN